MQNCCLVLIVIFVQSNMIYHIFTRNSPNYGDELGDWAFIIIYQLLFHCPSGNRVCLNKHNDNFPWPGFEPRTDAYPWSGGKHSIHYTTSACHAVAQLLGYNPERVWRYLLTNAQSIHDCGAPGCRSYCYLSRAVNAERFNIALDSSLADTTRLLYGTEWIINCFIKD